MIDQEKVRLMTRLSILIRQHGRQIKRAENSFRIDMITNPIWKKVFLAMFIFITCAVLFAVINFNAILYAVAKGHMHGLVVTFFICLLCSLLISVVFSILFSLAGYRKAILIHEQYRLYLKRIRDISEREEKHSMAGLVEGETRQGNIISFCDDVPGGRIVGGMGGRMAGRKGHRSYMEQDFDEGEGFERGEDFWEDEKDPHSLPHSLTVRFEDDDYIYNVEAIPKSRGRRNR